MSNSNHVHVSAYPCNKFSGAIFILVHIRNIRQYMQCTYNVTLRRVRATVVAVEKQ